LQTIWQSSDTAQVTSQCQPAQTRWPRVWSPELKGTSQIQFGKVSQRATNMHQQSPADGRRWHKVGAWQSAKVSADTPQCKNRRAVQKPTCVFPQERRHDFGVVCCCEEWRSKKPLFLCVPRALFLTKIQM